MVLLAALIVAIPIAWLASELRAVRVAVMTPPAEPSLEELTGCLHPVDARIDSSTSGTWRWRCDPKKGGCGFEHEEPMRPVVDAVKEQLARDLARQSRMHA